jgi:predicted transporter
MGADIGRFFFAEFALLLFKFPPLLETTVFLPIFLKKKKNIKEKSKKETFLLTVPYPCILRALVRSVDCPVEDSLLHRDAEH